MHTLVAALGIVIASQTPPPNVGRGHEAPKISSTDFKIGSIGGPPAASPVANITETADIGLKLPPSERRMRLVVNDMKIDEALKQVSEVGEIKVVLSPDVKGTVSLKLEDVSWGEAFHALLKAKKLGFMRERSVITVDTMKNIRHRAENRPRALSDGKPMAGAPLITVLLPVKFATADELMPVVRSMLTSRGSVAVDKRTNSLIVTDVAAEQIRERLVLEL